MSVKDLRVEIDKVDKDLVKLIANRVILAQAIGNAKKSHKNKVIDLDRERKVLKNVAKAALKEGVSQADIEKIYNEIISACRGAQVPKLLFKEKQGLCRGGSSQIFWELRTTSSVCLHG